MERFTEKAPPSAECAVLGLGTRAGNRVAPPPRGVSGEVSGGHSRPLGFGATAVSASRRPSGHLTEPRLDSQPCRCSPDPRTLLTTAP